MWPFSDEDGEIKQPVEPEMEQSGVKDPLVKQYMLKKMGLDQAYQTAKENDDYNRKVEGVGRILGGIFGSGQNNDQFYQHQRAMSENQIDKADAARGNLIKDFSAQRQLQDWESKDKETAEERDPNSMKSQVARSVALKFGGSKIIPAEKLATMSAADINKHLPYMKDAYEQDVKQQMVAEAAKSRQQAHADAVAMRNQAKAEKIAEAKAELNVPGFNLGSEVKPGKVEASKAREALGTYNEMVQNLEDLHQLVKDNGSFEYGGEAGTRMGGLAQDIRLQLKQMANLGVLSKTDYALLDKQLQDPTSFKQIFSRDSSALAQIEQLKELAGRKLASGMASKGYAPNQEMAERLSPPKKDGKQDTDGVAFGASGQLTADDETAIMWAKNNPGDPRAKKILEMHGVK